MVDEKTNNNQSGTNKKSAKDRVNKYERGDFLKKLGTGVFGSMVLSAVYNNKFTTMAKTINKNSDTVELAVLPEQKPDEDQIIRMMRDLQRALKKPVEKRKWSMVIDLRKCVGCYACTVSCIAENKLPPGVVYRPVLSEEIGTYPNTTERYIPRPCMQCEDPPCVQVCPVHATWKRKDGIIEIDYDQCIGCRYCITACPYSARTFDKGHYYTEDAPKTKEMVGEKAKVYEVEPMFAYGKPWPREDDDSPIGNARKCHFCIHRVEKGMLPACVVSCIGRATYFGDANDSRSLVAELIGKPNVMRLKEEMGTNPKVYYLL
jgi:molybdopterin-containing oxidoreductase family iron-sulfur binding subunit